MEEVSFEKQLTKYNFTLAELENLENRGMALGPRILWDILFVTMIAVGVAGNLMVLWIVTGTETIYIQPWQKRYIPL